MKEIKFADFVKGLTSKLDSLHGNKGANMYELCCQYGYSEDEKEVNSIKALEAKLGESLWHVDKGGNALTDFIDTLDSDKDLGEKNGIKFLGFEQDVRVYIGSSRSWGYELYMNVRRVVLPPKKPIEAKGKERLWIYYWNGAYYKLPYLKYPSSVKDLLKWMKQKKLITAKPSEIEIWNKNISVTREEEIYDMSDSCPRSPKGIKSVPDTYINQHKPMRNIKSESDLKAYNEWLLNDHKTWIRDVYNPYSKKNSWHGRTINPDTITELKPIEVPITQDTVDKFVSEYNGKFKIER
jgi:hypothetical protein